MMNYRFHSLLKKQFLSKTFVLVLPTRIERNKWFCALNVWIKGDLKEESSPAIKVQYFQDLAQNNSLEKQSRIISVPNWKDLNYDIRIQYDLGVINMKLIEHNKKLRESTIRKVIDLNDLKNLPDTDESSAFINMKFSEQAEEENILCFREDSDDEKV